MDRIVIRTNFTNTPARTHRVSRSTTWSDARSLRHPPRGLLRSREAPARTRRRSHHRGGGRHGSREIAHALGPRPRRRSEVAHFLDRLVFCLFAEDVGLLPDTALHPASSKSAHGDPARFGRLVGQPLRGHGPRRRLRRGDDPPLQRQPVRRRRGRCASTRRGIATHRPVTGAWTGARSTLDLRHALRARPRPGQALATRRALHQPRRHRDVVEPVVMAPLRREWEQPCAREVDGTADAARQARERPTTEKARRESSSPASLRPPQTVTVLDPPAVPATSSTSPCRS